MLITQTPLRISLAGGGTDLPDYYREHTGYVVSTAIDKYIYVIVNERYDDMIYVDYTKKEIVSSIDEIKHELVREAARKTGMTKGFEVAMLADIPSEGSGLGSSSSLTVGLLNAFYHYQGVQADRERLAREACEIEIDILGKPIGRQDQYIAAFGGLRGFTFYRENGLDLVDVEDLPIGREQIRRLGNQLLLFFTDIVRSSSTILSQQKESIPDTIEVHHQIKDLAYQTRDALSVGSFDNLGEYLDKNWRLKKSLAPGITNETIDEMYARALRGGALGGKISGAGGGGFLLSYCNQGEQDRLRNEMSEYREMNFSLDPKGSRLIFQHQRQLW